MVKSMFTNNKKNNLLKCLTKVLNQAVYHFVTEVLMQITIGKQYCKDLCSSTLYFFFNEYNVGNKYPMYYVHPRFAL